MTLFPETTEAFPELEANARHGFGMHIAGNPRTGSPGLMMGDMQFDPAKHYVGSINPLSVLGNALDEPYVSNVLPNKPLHISVITDFTNRAERAAFTSAKRTVAESVTTGLTDAVESSIGNLACLSLIGEQEGRRPVDEFIESRDREVTLSTAADIAQNGLTIVLSDFFDMKPEEGSLKDVLAIKVDHWMDRTIPSGIGQILVGDGKQVDTGKRRELDYRNKANAEKHGMIVAGLQQAGARVVSIVADGRFKPHGFDVPTADTQLAAEIEAKAR